MLLRYGIANHLSIREFQELSLLATSLTDSVGAVIPIQGLPYNVLRVAAIYGANASGKSNVLSGLEFIRYAVKNSHSKWQPGDPIPRSPFLLDDSCDKPSEFMIDFLFDGSRFEYGFAVTDTEVVHEYLYTYPGNRKVVWFERSGAREKMSFGKKLTGENRVIETLTRPNSLFLSAAAQNNHEQLSPLYNWFASRLRFRSGLQEHAGSLGQTLEICSDERLRNTVLRFLAAADLGISGIEITEDEIPPNIAKFSENLKGLLEELIPKGEFPQQLLERKRKTMSLQHRGSGDRLIPIPVNMESAGTLAYLRILGPILDVLATGGILCVDELDSSLHPLLVAEIVKTFNAAESNPRGAQLIFNTHDVNLLGESILRRDEVWFTEKDYEGATRIFPLSDFKLRKDENFQRGYLQGRYGGTPYVQQVRIEIPEVGGDK